MSKIELDILGLAMERLEKAGSPSYMGNHNTNNTNNSNNNNNNVNNNNNNNNNNNTNNNNQHTNNNNMNYSHDNNNGNNGSNNRVSTYDDHGDNSRYDNADDVDDADDNDDDHAEDDDDDRMSGRDAVATFFFRYHPRPFVWLVSRVTECPRAVLGLLMNKDLFVMASKHYGYSVSVATSRVGTNKSLTNYGLQVISKGRYVVVNGARYTVYEAFASAPASPYSKGKRSGASVDMDLLSNREGFIEALSSFKRSTMKEKSGAGKLRILISLWEQLVPTMDWDEMVSLGTSKEGAIEDEDGAAFHSLVNAAVSKEAKHGSMRSGSDGGGGGGGGGEFSRSPRTKTERLRQKRKSQSKSEPALELDVQFDE